MKLIQKIIIFIDNNIEITSFNIKVRIFSINLSKTNIKSSIFLNLHYLKNNKFLYIQNLNLQKKNCKNLCLFPGCKIISFLLNLMKIIL